MILSKVENWLIEIRFNGEKEAIILFFLWTPFSIVFFPTHRFKLREKDKRQFIRRLY